MQIDKSNGFEYRVIEIGKISPLAILPALGNDSYRIHVRFFKNAIDVIDLKTAIGLRYEANPWQYLAAVSKAVLLVSRKSWAIDWLTKRLR